MGQPRVNDISYRRFLEAEKLMGARCRRCGCRFVPPRPLCAECRAMDMEWFEAAGEGRLAAFTVISVVPPAMEARGFGRHNPYVSGVVALDAGGRVDARIIGVDVQHPESIQIGMRVRVAFLHERADGRRSTSLAFAPI